MLIPDPACSLRMTADPEMPLTRGWTGLLGAGRKEKELQRESPALSWSATGLFELSFWASVFSQVAPALRCGHRKQGSLISREWTGTLLMDLQRGGGLLVAPCFPRSQHLLHFYTSFSLALLSSSLRYLSHPISILGDPMTVFILSRPQILTFAL